MNNYDVINDNLISHYEWVINLLVESRMKKIALFVNGVDYSNRDISDVCLVLEENTYMSDFVGDDKGNIIQLHFDKVEVG